MITGLLGCLRQQAIFKATNTSSVVMVDFIDQPTTMREYKSMTTAKYSHPS
jgi:hypothetical protein